MRRKKGNLQKLFVIYIGGSHEKSFIEMYDMQFMVANPIEETYDELRKSWRGTSKSLHLEPTQQTQDFEFIC